MHQTMKIARSVTLAPMAGVTDSAFRRICKEQSVAMCTSEMISAKALTMDDQKSRRLAAFTPGERPFGIQIFGYEAATMAQAAAQMERDFSPDFIDINMGCPTPKITNSGSGSALMADPKKAFEIARAVCASVSIPVSAKIRAGFHSVNAPEIARMLEEAGISFLTVHGRTRQEMYRGRADLKVIADVKKSVSLPVIGNGDIACAADALRMLNMTGCDAVSVGRGALGNPFVFAQIHAALQDQALPPEPDLQTRLATLRRQVMMMVVYKGETIALAEARKHAAWYTKGIRGAAKLRATTNTLSTMSDLDRFIDSVLQTM